MKVKATARASKSFTGKRANTFSVWIDTFLSEKGIDGAEIIEVEGATGINILSIGHVVESVIGFATREEQAEIKRMLVKIDFANGNVRHFLTHLAKAVAL